MPNGRRDYFKVEDNIRRADMLLGATYRRGDATRAALVLGAQGLLNELKRSNLRGRGGAGFTTAVKWETCRDAPGERRFVICNADEGEPGTFKDRVLLQSFAERVFEGMTLAGSGHRRATGLSLSARRIFLFADAAGSDAERDAPRKPARRTNRRRRGFSTSTSKSISAPAPISAARKRR